MNILIVDDEEVQLKSLKRGLKSFGHMVVTFACADEAIDYLLGDSGKTDLLLTDYSMPEMNGLELAKKIRSFNATLPIILMTAYGEKSLVVEALHHRCDGFIEKPFSTTLLKQEIERIGRSMVRDSESSPQTDRLGNLVDSINNGLMSIMGYAELGLFQIDDPGKIKEHLNSILSVSKKIKKRSREIRNLKHN